MIHHLLNLTRPLYLIDTETTGVDTQADRIIEYGLQKWTADGMVGEWRTLVNCQQPIPAPATKVHGITNGDLVKCQECDRIELEHAGDHQFKAWPLFKNIARVLAERFTDCDFAGKNVRFDLRITLSEMMRAGVDWSYAGARVIDADRLEQLAIPRDLGSLHAKYAGRKHDGAHGALSDVRASATVIAAQLEAHASLPRDLDALHAAQWPGWITAGGEFRMEEGTATCAFGKHRGRPLTAIPLDYWDWICREKSLPADVRAIAAKAKLGEFPK